MAIDLSTVTSGGWFAFAGAVALGLWLIVGRERWTKDVYQPPLSALGPAGPVISAAIGVLLIVAAVWAVITDL